MLSFGPVVLGGNVFGWTVDRDAAFVILDAFLEKGGRAIDTADVYPAWAPGCIGGESEAIVGAWMASRKVRDRVVIATKVAKWPTQPGLSPKNIEQAIEGSLRRLQTDYVDLYYAHQDDESIEQVEYLRAFDGLVRAGKVRTLGASNFKSDRLASALAITRKNGLASFAVSQDKWNLVERDIETTLVPLLEREQLVELPYYSLASGFLTGKYRPGAAVASERAEGASKYLADPKNVELLATLDALAEKHRVSVSAIALAWLRSRPCVGAPIASARTVEQLDPFFETVTLDAEDLARLT